MYRSIAPVAVVTLGRSPDPTRPFRRIDCPARPDTGSARLGIMFVGEAALSDPLAPFLVLLSVASTRIQPSINGRQDEPTVFFFFKWVSFTSIFSIAEYPTLDGARRTLLILFYAKHNFNLISEMFGGSNVVNLNSLRLSPLWLTSARWTNLTRWLCAIKSFKCNLREIFMQLQPGNASTFRIFFANFSFKFEKVTSTESIRRTFCCRYFFPGRC